MSYPDIYATYAALDQSSTSYPQSSTSNYDTQYSTSDQYTGTSSRYSTSTYDYSNQHSSSYSYPQYQSQYNSSQYNSSNGNSQYSNVQSNYNSADNSSYIYQNNTQMNCNRDSSQPHISGSRQKTSSYSSSSSGYQSGRNTSVGGPRGGGKGGAGELLGIKCTKITPFRTDHLYDCPTTGQPIHCITCDVTIPSYSIASIHFNSPKHHRKRMNELHYPSEKRQKLAESSEADSFKLECVTCNCKPGSFNGFLSHMVSPKHLKKMNNLGPESREFNVTCAPCDQKLTTIEMLNEHVKSKEHIDTVSKKIKERYPDLTDNSSQWYCALCNKSCNSMQTFDAHCASVKHYTRMKALSGKDDQETEAEQIPPLRIEKEVVIPDVYQCKVCNFASSDKVLIDKHYETASHKANKLLKRRHDELYRVSDVGKREHKGLDLGDIVPLNSKGAVHCEVCDLRFAHVLLLEIHNRGRLHREMKVTMETEHDKVQESVELEPANKGGHHCDACNVHTSCLTFYIAHVSSKEHRRMMARLAKSGVVPSAPAKSKCELRDSALTPLEPRNTTPSVSKVEFSSTVPQIHSYTFEDPEHLLTKKQKKKKRAENKLRFSEYKVEVIPSDGIPPEAILEDGTFECKLCSVVVQQKHAYIQHCKGRRHLSKTNIRVSFSAGCSGPDNNPEVFYCKMCNVSCATGADTLAHLSSKEHTQGPKQELTLPKEEELQVDPAEITNKFYCEICSLDCRSESAYAMHVKGLKHMKKLTALTDEAEKVLDKRDCSSNPMRKNLSCVKCRVHCKSLISYEEHCASFQHKLNTSKVHIKHPTPRAGQTQRLSSGGQQP